MNNSNPFIYLSHREVRELRWQVTWDSPGRRPAVVDPGGGARSQPPAKGRRPEELAALLPAAGARGGGTRDPRDERERETTGCCVR